MNKREKYIDVLKVIGLICIIYSSRDFCVLWNI